MNVTLYLIPLVLVFIVLLVLRSQRNGPQEHPVRATPILTRRELDFFEILGDAVDHLPVHLCPQVSLDSMMRTVLKDPRERESFRARYKQKRCDYALMDESGAVVLVVELDDSSHDNDRTRQTDRFRDAVLASTGIPTLRIPKGGLPHAPDVRARIADLLRATDAR